MTRNAHRIRRVAAILAWMAPVAAGAQPADGPTLVGAPGVSVAAPDDATSVDVNPAALALLPSWDLRLVHVEGSPDAGLPDGTAVRLGAPLLFGLAAGVSVNHVRPKAGGGAPRGTGSLALAWAGSPQLGFGTTFRVTGSDDPLFSGRLGWDLAGTWRPTPLLAVSLVARDVNALIDLGNAGAATRPTAFVLGAALRPSGEDHVTLDMATGLDTEGDVHIRGLVLARVPHLGRVFVGGELRRLDLDAQWLVDGGMSVDWGGASVGGGIQATEAGGTPGAFVTAGLGGTGRAGLPEGGYVLDLEVGSAGPRGVLGLLMGLHRATLDEDVRGVLVRFRDSGLGTAHAEEVREAFLGLRRKGTPVICHLDAASNAEFYACAAATHTLLDPAGGVRLVGPAGTGIYMGEALHRLGIRAEFVRIGDYKSAPEQYTYRSPTDAAREARNALYDDVYRTVVADLAKDFRTSDGRIERLIDHGPYLTGELVGKKLVRAEADEHDMDATLAALLGGNFPREADLRRRHPAAWGVPGRVAVVVVDGDIVDGDNVDIPIVGIQSSGGKTIAETLDAFASDPTVAAIVLRVDSPGGSVLASDQIWRAVMRARKQKPVVASMGSVAASGGYYIASAADEIWADKATLTGSIGVFFGKADVAALAAKLHVGFDEIARGKRAGVESIYRPLTEDERAMLKEKVLLWYQLFLRRIEEGRGKAPLEIDKVARGRVWSGAAAHGHGLVDELGGFLQALHRARALGNLPPEADVVFAPSRPTTLLDFALREFGLAHGESARQDGASPLPADVRAMAGALSALLTQREGVGMARLEDVLLTP